MQKKQPPDSEVKITVWLPAEIVEALKAVAAANERSFKGEVTFALRKYLRARRPRRAGEPGGPGDLGAPEAAITPALEAPSSDGRRATDLATDRAIGWSSTESA